MRPTLASGAPERPGASLGRCAAPSSRPASAFGAALVFAFGAGLASASASVSGRVPGQSLAGAPTGSAPPRLPAGRSLARSALPGSLSPAAAPAQPDASSAPCGRGQPVGPPPLAVAATAPPVPSTAVAAAAPPAPSTAVAAAARPAPSSEPAVRAHPGASALPAAPAVPVVRERRCAGERLVGPGSPDASGVPGARASGRARAMPNAGVHPVIRPSPGADDHRGPGRPPARWSRSRAPATMSRPLSRGRAPTRTEIRWFPASSIFQSSVAVRSGTNAPMLGHRPAPRGYACVSICKLPVERLQRRPGGALRPRRDRAGRSPLVDEESHCRPAPAALA